MVLVGAGLSACSAAQGPIQVTSGLAQTFNGRAAQGRKGCPQCLPGLARAMPALTARGAWYARTKRTRPSSETSPCRKHARPAEHARRDRLGRRQLQVPIGCSKQCTHPRTSIGRHRPDIIVRPGVRVRRDSLLVEESAPSNGSTLTCRGSSDHLEAQIHSRQISGRACGYRSTI
jgi:hypothetical protein